MKMFSLLANPRGALQVENVNIDVGGLTLTDQCTIQIPAGTKVILYINEDSDVKSDINPVEMILTSDTMVRFDASQQDVISSALLLK